MANSSKRKGDVWERECAAWCRRNGYPEVERMRAGWAEDRGDLDGVPGLVIECKAVKTPLWGAWLSSLDWKMGNAGARDGVLWVKRQGVADPGEGLIVQRARNYFVDPDF